MSQNALASTQRVVGRAEGKGQPQDLTHYDGMAQGGMCRGSGPGQPPVVLGRGGRGAALRHQMSEILFGSQVLQMLLGFQVAQVGRS